MREYTIVFARSARKELQALDRGVAGRVLKRIEALTKDPRPAGCKKLQGAANLWRIRVGDWRVVYSVDDTGAAAPWRELWGRGAYDTRSACPSTSPLDVESHSRSVSRRGVFDSLKFSICNP